MEKNLLLSGLLVSLHLGKMMATLDLQGKKT